MYRLEHGKEMSTHAISEMLSRTLYYRRFFVYYTFNILAGIDDKGEGFVYSYDAVGSFEAKKHAVNGDGGVLAIPLLDNFVEKKHRQLADKKREITTGDSADIYVITKEGTSHEIFPLRKD